MTNLQKIAFVCFVILTMVVDVIFIIVLTGDSKSYVNISNGIVNTVYRYKTNINDDVTSNLALLCSSLNTQEKQILCVYRWVNDYYQYDYDRVQDNDASIFISSEDLINNGGVCRDYALFYARVFKQMGYDYAFIFEPNHVYINVFAEYSTYLIDQTFIGEQLYNQSIIRTKLRKVQK